jgi:hypothetical protein
VPAQTAEPIVETLPREPRVRRPRRQDESMVGVRIAWCGSELRERAKRLGAIRRPAQRLWQLRWIDAKRLGISDRVVHG